MKRWITYRISRLDDKDGCSRCGFRFIADQSVYRMINGKKVCPSCIAEEDEAMTDETLDKVADGIAKDIGPVEPVPLWVDRLGAILFRWSGLPRSEESKQAGEDLILMARLADEAEAARKAKQ